MTAYRTDRRGRRAAKGTALVELAVCIPLLAAIIGLTMFWGWATMNIQNVGSAARYSAWRMVYGWPPPEGYDANDPNSPNVGDPNYNALNGKFFRDKADQVGLGGGSGPTEELDKLCEKAAEKSAEAGQLADELVMNTWQKAQQATVSAHFPTDVGLWQEVMDLDGDGPIRRRHVRDGHTWYRSRAGCRDAIREQYLSQLDEALQSVESPGYELAMRIRGWYTGGW